MSAELAFGITAGSRPAQERLGAEVERLGYRELWVNDTRRGDGVATLAQIAPGTRRLGLAVGVVALSEHRPPSIIDRISRAGLPLERLTLGVGAGSSASLSLVRDGVEQLRSALPGVPIAVAAVGPRMLRLAGEVADVVVATWALPDRVAWIRDRVAEGAASAGRRRPRIALYVRVAIGRGATDRLRAEMDRYARQGSHYARAFAAQPDRPVGVAVESADPEQIREAMASYRSAADTVVVRALPPDDSVDAWVTVARSARG